MLAFASARKFAVRRPHPRVQVEETNALLFNNLDSYADVPRSKWYVQSSRVAPSCS